MSAPFHPRYKLIAAVVVGTVLCGVWLLLTSKTPPRSGPEEWTAKKVPLQAVHRERGTLSSDEKEPVTVRCGWRWDGGQILTIEKSGTPVKEGQLVATIEATESRRTLKNMRSERLQAIIQKTIHEAQVALKEVQERKAIEFNHAKLEHAILEERIELRGLTPEERRLLQIDIELGVLDLEDAQDEYTRQKRLMDKGFISASMLDPYSRRLQSSKVYLEELRRKKALEEKGIEEERKVELRRAVERSEALVERGERSMARELEAIQNLIEKQEATIAEKEFVIEKMEERLSNSRVLAPREGIFVVRLFVDWRSGGRWRENAPGTRLYGNAHIADVIDPEAMQVECLVNEADFSKLKEGLPARVRLPAFPGRSFQGTLAKLGGLGRDRFDLAPMGQEEAKTGVATFNATVTFDGEDARLRPGMSALVEILLGGQVEVLVVPREALRETDDGVQVTIEDAQGEAHIQRIQGSFFDEQHFAVSEGLSEGDVVVMEVKGGGDL